LTSNHAVQNTDQSFTDSVFTIRNQAQRVSFFQILIYQITPKSHKILPLNNNIKAKFKTISTIRRTQKFRVKIQSPLVAVWQFLLQFSLYLLALRSTCVKRPYLILSM